MILNEFSDVKLKSNSIKYYEDLGYKIPLKYSKSKRKMVCDYSIPIKVKTNDLQKGSHVLIKAKCDFCGIENNVTFRAYYKNCIEKDMPYACFDCGFEKQKMNNMKKYGVENQMQLDSFRKKSKETMLNKYGVAYPMQSKQFREKSIATSIENYGYDNPMKNNQVKEKLQNVLLDKYGKNNVMKVESVREKAYQTNIKRYGYKNPAQSPKIHRKIVSTTLKRYGVEYPAQNKTIAKKISDTKYLNGNVNTSRQQLYLNEIYDGTLNFPCGQYNIDIYIKEENIAIEYNGGGHDLCVVFNQRTRKEFDIQEIIRGKFLRTQGLYQILIISRYDKLPERDILLHMFDISKDYFNSTNHTWVEWDIDNNTVKNAENLEGSYFNYGKVKHLKRIS